MKAFSSLNHVARRRRIRSLCVVFREAEAAKWRLNFSRADRSGASMTGRIARSTAVPMRSTRVSRIALLESK
jgi:hypothetical protein